jgi:hypothetical protein
MCILWNSPSVFVAPSGCSGSESLTWAVNFLKTWRRRGDPTYTLADKNMFGGILNHSQPCKRNIREGYNFYTRWKIYSYQLTGTLLSSDTRTEVEIPFLLSGTMRKLYSLVIHKKSDSHKVHLIFLGLYQRIVYPPRIHYTPVPNTGLQPSSCRFSRARQSYQ